MKNSPRHTPAHHRGIMRSAAILAIVAVLCLAFAGSAFAAPPNLIISDSQMRAYYSMTPAQIHAFLAAHNGPLKSDPSFARHDGGAAAPVSVIVWEACQKWGISPRVMLTMLQKEQSLIDAPTTGQTLQYRYDWAIGMGRPDSGARYTQYQGFGNQLWYGTWRLDGYGELKPGVTDVPKWKGRGDTTWMPSGAAPINISTWKLYVYNPSITGNTNFYNIYTRYFGDPTTGFIFTPITGPAGTVFRFYNGKLGSHFYTISVDEANNVQDRLWSTLQYEGPAYVASQSKNKLQLWRFHTASGSHFYTASIKERDDVYRTLSKSYIYDGAAYFVSPIGEPGATPVYRFLNKKNGTHFYTASDAERDSVLSKYLYLYTYEGPAFSVLAP